MGQQKNQTTQDFDSWTREQYLQALQWHVDHDCAEMVELEARDKTKPPTLAEISHKIEAKPSSSPAQTTAHQTPIVGAAQAMTESMALAQDCQNLDELKQAIHDFNGLSVKKTATNMVFSDGNPEARIMLIGEAPGADEDAQGKPFVGMSGQLLDKILASIGLSRTADDLKNAVYISNILNWRPPGNRTPTAQEIEISLPFIERHIALINPDYLILCGGVSGKSLLRSKESISRLRGNFHDYQVPEKLRDGEKSIKTMATYHPAYLLRTPAQKRAVWHDMLMLKADLSNS